MMKMLGSLIASAALILASTGCGLSLKSSSSSKKAFPVTQVSAAVKGSDYQYTAQDVRILRDYLLNIPVDLDLRDKPYDLNGDKKWNAFDLTLMKHIRIMIHLSFISPAQAIPRR